MDKTNFDEVEQLIGASYSNIAQQSRQTRNRLVTNLLSQRRVPEIGWDDLSVQQLLYELSGYESNNVLGTVGVGEREGRVYSQLVKTRHYGFSHGIGRSGDLMALQPKAPGSSLINKLARYLALDMLKEAGLKAIKDCIILPLATGMSIHLCVSYLRLLRPKAEFILWSRIDQKSCFKALLLTGLQIIIIELELRGESLTTNITGIHEMILNLGPSSILCVVTTTSTFAPRTPDNIPEVAKICAEFNIPHIINNAYGLQCGKCTHLIELGCRTGRVDFIIQSTDKNFMVPVGGSIICSPNTTLVSEISQQYPGRASGSPTLDLFITFLQMGRSGYIKLREERKQIFHYLKTSLLKLSNHFPIRLLDTPQNGISLAIQLDHNNESNQLINDNSSQLDYRLLGSALFTRRCSGAKVILSFTPGVITYITPQYPFCNFGTHCNDYPPAGAYLTVACAIGIDQQEVDIFLERFTLVLKQHYHINSSLIGITADMKEEIQSNQST